MNQSETSPHPQLIFTKYCTSVNLGDLNLFLSCASIHTSAYFFYYFFYCCVDPRLVASVLEDSPWRKITEIDSTWEALAATVIVTEKETATATQNRPREK